MAAALDVPGPVWLAALQAAAPSGSPLARMEWQRALTALASTCKFFRCLLHSVDADALFTEAAVVRLPAGQGSCAAYALSLPADRARLIQRLDLEVSALEEEDLTSFLPHLTGLRSLQATHICDAVAAGKVVNSLWTLPSLAHLSWGGPCPVACGLPAQLTSLELSELCLDIDLSQDQHSSVLAQRVCGKLLDLGLWAVSSLHTLTLRFQLGPASKRPGLHLKRFSAQADRAVSQQLQYPEFPSIASLHVDVTVPVVSKSNKELSLQPAAPTEWCLSITWRFWVSEEQVEEQFESEDEEQFEEQRHCRHCSQSYGLYQRTVRG